MALSLKGILGTVAPILAGALPGPLGGVARKVLEEVLGKPGASDAEIEKTLANANPEMLLRLKEAEQKFQLDMEQLGVDLEKLAAEDRQSARAMQVATKARTPSVLAAVFVGGWVAFQVFLMIHAIPNENREIMIRALGTFDAALMIILGFFFGSSSSSKAKDDTISKLRV